MTDITFRLRAQSMFTPFPGDFDTFFSDLGLTMKGIKSEEGNNVFIVSGSQQTYDALLVKGVVGVGTSGAGITQGYIVEPDGTQLVQHVLDDTGRALGQIIMKDGRPEFEEVAKM